MPRHNTEQAQAMRERNAEIIRMVGEGSPHRDVVDSMGDGLTVYAVQGVMARHRKAEHKALSVQQSVGDKTRKARSLQAAGISHVSGWIEGKDEPIFQSMLNKAAPVVERVTKGDE